MNKYKLVLNREIFTVKFYSNTNDGKVLYNTVTLEDAYKLAEDYIGNRFDMTVDDVREVLCKRRSSDYVELFDKSMDYFSDFHGKRNTEFANCKYYFTIVRTELISNLICLI
jgi:hypothetical protein